MPATIDQREAIAAALAYFSAVGGASSPSSREEGTASSLIQGQAGPATPGQAALATLRQKFEELHPALRDTHPLRIALDKLATLEITRIIEGRS